MKHYELILPTSIKQQLIEHAQQITPIESCGYLGGTLTDNIATATTFYPMTNTDNSPEHFTFDPKEQFQVVKQARQANESLIAVYHSHPASPARLSAEDIRLFNDPHPVYIIVSLANDSADVQGFKVFKENKDSIEIVNVNITATKEA